MYFKSKFKKTKDIYDYPSYLSLSMYKDKAKKERVAYADVYIFPEFDLVYGTTFAIDLFDMIDGDALFTMENVLRLPEDKRLELSDYPMAYVYNFYVEDDFRGQGYALELLEYLHKSIKNATKCKAPAVVVLAETYNDEDKPALHRLLDRVSWLEKGNDSIYIS